MNFASPSEFIEEKLTTLGDFALMCGRAIHAMATPPIYWGDIFQQMDMIGIGSLPVILMTGFFTGCVLALQAKASLEQFGAVSMTGALVSMSMMKELGPVLTGLMASSRNSSGMASELGSMRVTEQIDAMRALGVDPIRKLVVPRLIATVFMLFFLTIISDAVGVAGGAMVASAILKLNFWFYFHSTYRALVFGDVVEGLTKPIFFGVIIATVGCYFGLNTKGGTQGVGRATTQAVVVSSISIIFMDFLLTQMMIGIFGR